MNQNSKAYQFLRSMHPEEFSDSYVKNQGKLDRSFLEYYLNTLTNRNQENDFEVFCRRLIEVEICPNILPHTGPSGGGDSKVDSETYPVSDSTAMKWYVGIGRLSASEKWAFAFSAKKAWKTKCKSDIEKIVNTNRDYKKIFFITNQFISDKNRSLLEDELAKKYGVSIHILDRNWILDKVFNNHHEDIAINALHLSENFKDEIAVGPLDYKRKLEVEELEKEIENSIANNDFSIKLVENAIKVAILCKEMELPLSDTKRRFQRAIDLAKSHGTVSQLKEACYEWAWALFWWYNNKEEFEKAYEEFETLVKGSLIFFDIERLTNLWMNLVSLYNRNFEDPFVKKKTEILTSEYSRLISDKRRKNTSNEARVNYSFVELMLGKDPNQVCRDLKKTIVDAQSSIDFRFRTIQKMLLVLSDFFTDNEEFDELFEIIITISESRAKEIDSAELLLTRGKSLYSSKPYSAIRYLGRSLPKLYKSESKNWLIQALFYIGVSFSNIGFYWASYGYILNAQYYAFIDYMKYGRVIPITIFCADMLRRYELANGFLSKSLEWNKLYNINKELAQSIGVDINRPEIGETDLYYDGLLGNYFLNLNKDEYKKLAQLPDTLDKIGLTSAALALRFSLGHIDPEITDVYKTKEEQDLYFSKWRDQPAKDFLSKNLFGGSDKVILKTKILGCNIVVSTKQEFPCTEFARSILASIESFMATSILDRIIARYPSITINIQRIDNDDFLVEFSKEVREDSIIYNIKCGTYDDNTYIPAQVKYFEFIHSFLTDFVARSFIFADTTQLEKLIVDDEVFNRAIEFTNCIFFTDDLIGRDCDAIERWIIEGAKSYELIENTHSEKHEPEIQVEALKKKNDKLSFRHGIPDNFDLEKINSAEVEMNRLINIPLWEKAEWKGVLYACELEVIYPPTMALVFGNKNACTSIFKKWISDIGHDDVDNKIRCCIIRDIDKGNPYHYRVAISPNIFLDEFPKATQLIVPAKFQTMESKDITSRDLFLKILCKTDNRFFLVPAFIQDAQPEIIRELYIKKYHLEVKNAWEIGLDDWWAFAILPNDDPIIPSAVVDAPVIELLRWKNANLMT